MYVLIVYAATYTAKTISPALLARARSISAEHDRLSQQISNSYDVKIARKVGELSTTVKALNEWESEQKVHTKSGFLRALVLLSSNLVSLRTPGSSQ